MTIRRQPLDIEQLVRQYQAGATITEIGKTVDRDPGTVYERLRTAGVVFRGRSGVGRKPAVQVQAQMLAFIKAYMARRGFAPSVREITDAMAFKSDRSTRYQLAQIEKRGAIRRTPGVARGLVLLPGTEDRS